MSQLVFWLSLDEYWEDAPWVLSGKQMVLYRVSWDIPLFSKEDIPKADVGTIEDAAGSFYPQSYILQENQPICILRRIFW